MTYSNYCTLLLRYLKYLSRRPSSATAGRRRKTQSSMRRNRAPAAPVHHPASVTWNFSLALETMGNSAAAAGATDHGGGSVPLMLQESPPTRRAPSLALHVQQHILAERKRREKINQRFIELSAVTPGLKKFL
jgi:hypothetical protein